MKRTVITLVVLLIALTGIFAQSPQAMNYQAVVRNASGQVLISQNISLRISILQGSAGGSSVYCEEHSVTTDQFGMVHLSIGQGTLVSGDLSQADWGGDAYFLQVELDPAGGSNYTLMGASQLISVPYSFYSDVAGNASASDTSATNELQQLSLSNDTLYLSGGNEVYLDNLSDTSYWSLNGSDIYYSNGNVGIGSSLPAGKLEVRSDADAGDEDVIFSVINNNGDTVLAVYQAGVRILVADSADGKASGSKGGFAVGGFSTAKGLTNEYLVVSPDSVRIYIEDEDGTKASGSKGGFAVGGFSTAKDLTNEYLRVTTDSTRIYVEDSTAGFAITNIQNGADDNFLDLTTENYFIGHESGINNTNGTYNNFFGYQAGMWNDYGDNNVFIGYQSGLKNQGGCDNIGIGTGSFMSNISGSDNTAVGYQTLSQNVDGQSNTAIGNSTLLHNTTGWSNVGIGEQALYNNTSGGSNVAIGTTCFYSNTTGNNNTAVGNLAYFFGTYTNSTALGYQAAISASNQVRVGNSSVTSIGGYAAWSNLSDKRFKKNIQEDVAGLDFILRLEPVTYNIDMDKLDEFIGLPEDMRNSNQEAEKSQIKYSGFLAQDVEIAAQKAGYYFSGVDSPENDKDHYSLRYSTFVVPIVKAIQEQQKMIEELQAEIDELRSQLGSE